MDHPAAPSGLDSFAALLCVARADATIRSQLGELLALPAAKRQAVLRKVIDRLQRNGAPHEILVALVWLLDNEVAARAGAIIDTESERPR